MNKVGQKTFIDLPAVLFAEILCRWLDLRSLVRLDSAACNREIRDTLLELLASSHCVYTSSVNVENSLVVSWFRVRKLQMSDLSINAYFPELVKYLRVHFSSIRQLTCLRSEAIGMMNSYIRNLNTLTFRNIIAVPQLGDCLWLNANVQELRIERVVNLSYSHFDGLKLPQLRLLSLRGSRCDDELLGVIVRSTSVMQRIDIGQCKLITDAGVIALAQCCPLLSALGLSELPISDGALLQVTQLCPRITSIDLSDNDVITDLGVSAVAGNLNNLRSISIRESDSLSDVSIEHLTRCNASTLQSLHGGGLRLVRVAVLVSLLKNCPHLHTLSLDCDLNAYHADIVPHMYNLRTLTTFTVLSDDVLCLIANHCQKLQQLGIYSIYRYVKPNVTPTTTDDVEVPFSEATGHTRVMHEANTRAEYEENILTEKGLLALMDGLYQLRVLGVRSEELTIGQLPPFAQSVWRRLRPHIVFVDKPDFFHFNPLLE